jgi:hypothetical protein
MFDPKQFASSNVAPLSTQIEVCPEGEFPFVIGSDPKMLEPRHVTGTSDKGPYDFWVLDLTCECQDQNVKSQLGRDKVTARCSINLDIDANGQLDAGKGKNVSLGQLREALGQNTPDWNPGRLLGAGPFIGKVVHRDNPKGGAPFVNIVRTAKIS